MMREYENKLNLTHIAGIDEAGRGPVAGPVVAAAVILPKNYDNNLINDSKKLTLNQRLKAYEDIMKHALAIGVGVVDEKEIDEINILEATKKAMKLSVTNLTISPEHVLIDAVKLDLDVDNTSIIKGDQKSISIAAASIIAKVTRDNIMIKYDELYPNYGFKNHKGYLTKVHIEAIKTFGPCLIHRKTFAPISNYFKF